MRDRKADGGGLLRAISRRLSRGMINRAEALPSNPYNSRVFASLPTFAPEFQTAHPFKHIVLMVYLKVIFYSASPKHFILLVILDGTSFIT